MQSSEIIKKRLKPILEPHIVFGCRYGFKETVWTLSTPHDKRVSLIRDFVKEV